MKPIWKSKTFWANLIAATLAGVETAGLVNVIPEEHMLTYIGGLAVLNVALRMFTTQPVRVK